MSRPIRSTVAGLLALCAADTLALAQDKSWIAAGKDATVLVDLGEEGSGSGFCVDAAGLFITNHHVIAQARPGATVNVVVQPAGKGQRVLKATVVARSAAFDLAVLKTAEAPGIPALKLGDDSAVTETDTVTAFGYPFGKMLATNPGEYPGVSVNTGKVTSLRRDGTALSRLQIDASVNPGNSGGPVLDDKGQLIGVVVSGVSTFGGQSGVNFAIPVSKVKEFLKPAYVRLTPPEGTFENRYEASTFTAAAFQYGQPDAKDLTIELTLQTAGLPARTVVMKRNADGLYEAKTPAVVAPADGSLLPVAALTDEGLIHGYLRDGDVTIGEETIKWSQLKSFRRYPTPIAKTVDDRELTGALKSSAKLTVAAIEKAGEAAAPPRSIDVAGAVHLTLDDTSAVDAVVSYALTAKKAGNIVGTTRGEFPLSGAPNTSAGETLTDSSDTPAAAQGTGASEATGTTTTLRFPGKIDAVLAGAGGRVQVLRLRELRTWAIVDLAAGRVVGWVPVDSEKPVGTAGLHELIVASPDGRQLQRYDLRDGKRIATARLPRPVEIKELEMGQASDGPLMATMANTRRILIDPVSMREIPPTWAGGANFVGDPIRFSDDGQVLIGTNDGGWLARTRVIGDYVAADRVPYLGRAVPNYDGSLIYASDGLFDTRLQRVGAESEGVRFNRTSPTRSLGVNAQFSLAMTPSGFGMQVSLLSAFDGRPICPLPGIEQISRAAQEAVGDDEENEDDDKADVIPADRRFSVDPINGLMAALVSDNTLVIHRFDLDKALAGSGSDWLFVLSNPPTRFTPGTAYSYAVDVRAARLPLTYKLVTGPAGMTVGAKDGKVSWKPDAALASDQAPVTIEAADANGKVTRQTYVLTNAAARARIIAPPAGTPDKPAAELTDAEALKLADAYAALAAKDATPDSPAVRQAARYDALFLAAHDADDADRKRVVARAAKRKSTGGTDVLARMRESMFVIDGTWSTTKDGLYVQREDDTHPRMLAAVGPRGSSHLHAEFTADTESGEVNVIFPVGEGKLVLGLGGWDGCVGIVDIAGAPDDRVEKRPWRIEPGKRHEVDIYVTLQYDEARVAVDVDGVRAVAWGGKQSDAKVGGSWALPTYERIAVGTRGTAATFHEITLASLDAGNVDEAFGMATDFLDTRLVDLAPPAGLTVDAKTGTCVLTASAGQTTTAAYVLSKRFDRLEGSLRLPAGSFSIACDGVVKWRGTAGKEQPFSIDVRNVDRVELIGSGGVATLTSPRLRQSDRFSITPDSPVWTSVRAAATKKNGTKSNLVGGKGGDAFEEIFPNGGVLVGMRTSFSRNGNDWAVASLQAIYMTPDGAYHGGVLHGEVSENVYEYAPVSGFVVTQIGAKGDNLLDGFRLNTGRLTPTAVVEENGGVFRDWVGKQNQSGMAMLGVKGKPIIGLRGSAGQSIDALGVISAP